MAEMPDLVSPTVRAIYRLYEERHNDEQPRGYLGASNIGDSCQRKLWYGFRWCEKPTFDGRILRLFGSGNREEPRVHEELQAIGVDVRALDEDGKQFAVEACNGHFRGHMDGAVHGLLEAPQTWHVLEVKTASAKNFAAIRTKGVAVAQPKHFAQMQVYMGLSGMTRAAYVVVNKDTDDIYLERVELDKDVCDKLIAKAQSIIDAAEPPMRVSDDPFYWECKFCTFYEQCHGGQASAVNCRTCAHSTPFANGGWLCERFGEPVPVEVQRIGCDEHRFIPALVAAFLELEGVENNNVVIWRNKKSGAEVRQPDYSSKEIAAATDKAFLGDDFAKMVKTTFPGARVVASPPPADHPIQSDIPY